MSPSLASTLKSREFTFPSSLIEEVSNITPESNEVSALTDSPFGSALTGKSSAVYRAVLGGLEGSILSSCPIRCSPERGLSGDARSGSDNRREDVEDGVFSLVEPPEEDPDELKREEHPDELELDVFRFTGALGAFFFFCKLKYYNRSRLSFSLLQGKDNPRSWPKVAI